MKIGANEGAEKTADPIPAAVLNKRKAVAKYVTLFCSVFGYFALFRNALTDDAFITFSYARTLRESGTWGMFPGEVINTATSALNTILTAVAFAFGASPWCAIALAAAEFTAIAALLTRISRRLYANTTFARLTLVALLANPLILSTIGLESILCILLLLLVIEFWMQKRARPLGGALGLAFLARPDALLWIPVFLVIMRCWKHRLWLLACFAAVVVPWELFSWLKLSSLIPDTFVLKTNEAWGSTRYWNGLAVYFRTYPLAIISSFFLVPFLAFGWRGRSRDTLRLRLVLVVIAALQFGAYCVLSPPPYHWYYVPVLAPLLIASAMGAAELSRRWREIGRPRVATLEYAILGILGTAAMVPFAKAGGFPDEPPIHTNWAKTRSYEEIGKYLQEHAGRDEPVLSGGEVGALSFYSRRLIVDRLTDRHVLIPWLHEKNKQGGLIAWLVHLNYRNINIPATDYQLNWVVSKDPKRPEGSGWRLEHTWPASTSWDGRPATIHLWHRVG